MHVSMALHLAISIAHYCEKTAYARQIKLS